MLRKLFDLAPQTAAPRSAREHGITGSALHAAGAVRNAQQSSPAAASRSEGAGRRLITAKRAARGAPRPLRQPRRQSGGAVLGLQRGHARLGTPADATAPVGMTSLARCLG